MNLCLDLRFAKTLTTNKKAHGYTVSVYLSCVVNDEIWRFQVHLKSKNAFVFSCYLISYLLCMFILFRFAFIIMRRRRVSEGKDRENMNRKEKGQKNPLSQFGME